MPLVINMPICLIPKKLGEMVFRAIKMIRNNDFFMSLMEDLFGNSTCN